MRKQTNYKADFEENLSYHIYNRSINQENIFKEEKYNQLFLRKIKKMILPFFEIEAYCIMPNHFHFLVRVKPINEEIVEKIKWQGTNKSLKFQKSEVSYNEFLIDQFKRIFQSFAIIYNTENNRNGSVFQKKFKRVLIKDEFRWRHILGYIHHNPIHHKFKLQYEGWRYSSYLAFLSDRPTLIAKENVLKRFDTDIVKQKQEYLKFHQGFKLNVGMNNFYLDRL